MDRLSKYEVSDLILEITRECNMACEHCLRGDAQKYVMPYNTLLCTLSRFHHIKTLTFTGGEPSLAIPVMKQALEICQFQNLSVDGIWFATNGKENIDELLEVCDSWYEYCCSCYFGDLDSTCTNKEFTNRSFHWYEDFKSRMQIKLSADKYHDPILLRNRLKLMSRNYFVEPESPTSERPIFALGRGEAIPGAILKQCSTEILIDSNKNWISELYVNAHGQLITDCDIPYDDQDNYCVGSIFDPYCFEKLKEDYDCNY